MKEAAINLRTLGSFYKNHLGMGFPLYQLREIVRQLLRFIDCLERELRMMHCDIKDDNIGLLVNKATGEHDVSKLRVLDFGNSFKLQKAHMKGQAFSFKSPESFFEIPDPQTGGLAPTSDVWSLGIMLMQLATGKKIFKLKPPKTQFQQTARFSKSEKEIQKTL